MSGKQTGSTVLRDREFEQLAAKVGLLEQELAASEADNNRLRNARTEVLVLHPNGYGYCPTCEGVPYPCATRRALERES